MSVLQTLEMALDALLQVKPLYSKHDAITLLRQQIALEKMAENERELGIQMQPDDPVAHVVVIGDMVSVTTGSAGLKDLLALGDGAPLYTRPQPAAWVGLTDEEKRQILLDDPIDWINAIEAKLRSKNEHQ